MKIEGSTALVTGGARGLGNSFVDELLSRGAARVYATSRNPQNHPNPRVDSILLDVTDRDAVRNFAAAATDVNLVINNAGFNAKTQILGSDLTGLDTELQTNLFGLIHVIDAFSGTLAANGGGAILNVHSVRSWLANGTGYSISKAAAWSATNGIRLSLRGKEPSSPASTSASWTPI